MGITILEQKKIKKSMLDEYKKRNIALEAENRLLKRRLELANTKIKLLNKNNMKFCYLDKMNRKVIDTGFDGMKQNKNHNSDMCDKCGKEVGTKNLFKLPYVYCDKNDTEHEDVSYLIGHNNEGYRQYFCCLSCFTKETKAIK